MLAAEGVSEVAMLDAKGFLSISVEGRNVDTRAHLSRYAAAFAELVLIDFGHIRSTEICAVSEPLVTDIIEDMALLRKHVDEAFQVARAGQSARSSLRSSFGRGPARQ